MLCVSLLSYYFSLYSKKGKSYYFSIFIYNTKKTVVNMDNWTKSPFSFFHLSYFFNLCKIDIYGKYCRTEGVG